MAFTDGVWVVEGDSLSNDPTDWAGQTITNNYGPKLTSCTYNNVAAGGNTVALMVTQYDTQVKPLAPGPDNLKSYFTIMGGTNDIFAERDANDIYTDLKTLWANGREDGFCVVAFLVLPSDDYTGLKGTIWDELNPLIESDPTLYDYLVKYSDDSRLTDPTDLTYYNADGVHLNATGSTVLAEVVRTVLEGAEPTSRTAFGTLAAWNALTQGQRHLYDGGHYLTLKAAIDVHPGVGVDWDSNYYAISDTDNDFKISLPVDTNGYNINVKGNNFTINSNTSDSDISRTVSHDYEFNLENLIINFLVLKSPVTNAFVFIQPINESSVSNCCLNGGGNQGILAYNIGSGTMSCYANIVKDSYRGFSLTDGIVNLENNTVYDSDNIGIIIIGGVLNLKNNAIFDSSSSDIAGVYNDLGGNCTSDNKGSPGYQNVVSTDAMVDPVGNNFKPIENGPLKVVYSSPLIDENKTYFDNKPITINNSYSGALGGISSSWNGTSQGFTFRLGVGL